MDARPEKPKRKKYGQGATPEGIALRMAKLKEKPDNLTVEEISVRDPDRQLNEQQRRFAYEWAQGESLHSAAVRAGYSPNSQMAYRMAKDPAILKIYNQEKALYAESCQMTRKKVMDGFLEAADMARTLADPTALVSAFREIGRMAGYYEPVKRTLDINISGNVTMKKLESMGDADLLKLIKGEVEDVAFEMASQDEAEEGE